MSIPTIADNTEAGTQVAFPPPQLSITFGAVEENPNYKPPTNANQVFMDLMYCNRYEGDAHRWMLGISSPNGFQGASTAFVQLAAPTLLWICDWTVAQYNTVPQVPDPFSVGSEWVLLDMHVEPAMLGLAPDGGSPLYRISGTYVFGHKNPGNFSNYQTSPFAIAAFPKPQWMADTFTRTVPAASLTAGLATPQAAQRVPNHPPGLRAR